MAEGSVVSVGLLQNTETDQTLSRFIDEVKWIEWKRTRFMFICTLANSVEAT